MGAACGSDATKTMEIKESQVSSTTGTAVAAESVENENDAVRQEAIKEKSTSESSEKNAGLHVGVEERMKMTRVFLNSGLGLHTDTLLLRFGSDLIKILHNNILIV